MWGFIASGKTTICKTQAELNKMMMIYPYAKTKFFEEESQVLDWIRQNQRGLYKTRVSQFGNTASHGFMQVEYFIGKDCIYCNIDLKEFGRSMVLAEEHNGVVVDNRPGIIKLKITNTILNNMVIAHHCIAMQRILMILGEFVDVDFIVPDMSIYIALTSYNGKDTTINRVKDYMKMRVGGVSFTVKEYKA